MIIVGLPVCNEVWALQGTPNHSCWVFFLIYYFQSLSRIFHPSNALTYNMAQLTDNEETLTQVSSLSSNPKPVWNLRESLERIHFHLLNSRECLWQPDLWYTASHHGHWPTINIKKSQSFWLAWKEKAGFWLINIWFIIHMADTKEYVARKGCLC